MTRTHRIGLAAASLATLLAAASEAAPVDGLGLFSPSAALFFLKNQPTAGPADLVVQYGAPAGDWIPLAGDWDADETDTIGLHSLDRGLAGLRLENAPGFADEIGGTEAPGRIPIVGDWAGNGLETVGSYDPATGNFAIGIPFVAFLEFQYGPGGGHVPLAGDWDGDGKDSVGVYVDETDVLFLKNTNEAGPADAGYELAPRLEGELVIAGDFDGDGIDTIARYEPATSTFFIHDLRSPDPVAVVPYGPPGAGWLPFAWKPRTEIEILEPTDGFAWSAERAIGGTAGVRLRIAFRPEQIDAVEAHREFPPGQTTAISTASFAGSGIFPRFAEWAFDRPGSAFGRSFYVVLFTDDGRTLGYHVPDGAIDFP